MIGIGNTTVLQTFENVFGYHGKSSCAAGDIATHLFQTDGSLIAPYSNALCASAENLKQAKETIAIAYSSDSNHKVDAIIGGLRTGLIDTLITDEHTAQKVLAKSNFL